jgi:hypothetical protein
MLDLVPGHHYFFRKQAERTATLNDGGLHVAVLVKDDVAYLAERPLILAIDYAQTDQLVAGEWRLGGIPSVLGILAAAVILPVFGIPRTPVWHALRPVLCILPAICILPAVSILPALDVRSALWVAPVLPGGAWTAF